MKKQRLQSVTSLPPSPDEERHARAVKYTITMSVRVLCFLAIFVVPGWWRIIPVIGTVVLPYIAVVIANTATRSSAAAPERPGAVVLAHDTSAPDRSPSDRADQA